jgi:hypothetical protein
MRSNELSPLRIGLFGILLFALIVPHVYWVERVHAQTGSVNFLGAVSGTTVTNCGTPTLPSLCVVATGVYVWQNSTTGWVLIPTSASSAGVSSVSVCNAAGSNCGAALTGAVSLNIPTKATAAVTLQ